jgi:hypothetical protein
MAKGKLSTSKMMSLALAIIILPSVMLLIMDRFERSSFRELLRIDRDECVRSASDDDRLKDICRQSALQADDAYTSAHDTVWATRFLLLGIIYGLSIGIVSLRIRVKELEEKLDA